MSQLQWDSVNNPSPFGPDIGVSMPQEPLTIPQPDPGEFSLPVYVQTNVSHLSANVSRLFDSNQTVLDQHDTPAWYNFPARISAAAGAVSDSLQSTLVKVIILVSIVGVIAVFGMSYIQARGAKLAG
jgi:hypothetical protein